MPWHPHRSTCALALAAACLVGACQRAEPSTARTLTAPSVTRGLALVTSTRDSLPRHVGNALRCTSCHLDEGRRANAIPWIGVTSRYPQYRSRAGAMSTIEDRINGCFERSMNGSALPVDSRDMRDIVAYMTYLSRGAPAHGVVPGQGLPTMAALVPDTAHGARVYANRCVACHGPQGSGTPRAPALWGPQSYNIGAGMARRRTAASFIRHNMPYGNATLTDQQSVDVAAYIDSKPRPDLPGKAKDWPHGDAPPDVPYSTDANP